MKAIFACKLYKSSKRKDKIKAALQNPINAELVEQLDEYLGEEYRPVTKIDGDVMKTVPKHDNESGSSNTQTRSSGHGPSSGGLGGLSSALSGLDDDTTISEKYGDELDDDGNAAFDATQGTSSSDDDTSDDNSDTTANSATTVKKSSIVADTVVTKPFVETQVSLNGLAGELKGTLNARSSTTGVNRVCVKNNEIWIHYNDDINLNNVMTAVIDTLNSANYHYLIFNRLARTDNAIVFTINGNDTDNVMEPISNEK
jgi:hypothetical protein